MKNRKGLFSFVGTIQGLKKLMSAEHNPCAECSGEGVKHRFGCVAVE